MWIRQCSIHKDRASTTKGGQVGNSPGAHVMTNAHCRSGRAFQERKTMKEDVNLIVSTSIKYQHCIIISVFPCFPCFCGTRWFPRITLLETPLQHFLSWKDHGLRNAWNGFAHLGGAQPDRSLLIFGSGLQTKANGADKSKERHSWVWGQWGRISIAMLCPEVRLWG